MLIQAVLPVDLSRYTIIFSLFTYMQENLCISTYALFIIYIHD